MLGSRLKMAREAAGMSLRDLESAINRLVSAQAIGKYERDEMMPSSSALMALASALDVSPEYLMRAGDVSLVGVDFRRAPDAGAKEEKAVQATVLDHVERYLQLEELLQLPSATSWTVPLDSGHVDTPEQAEAAANELRRQWNLGADPIPDFSEFLEERGIKVIACDLPDNISGSKAMVRREGHADAPVIVINSRHTGERQRFTLAHELAHVVLQSGAFDEEKAADRFAGAFLVPGATLISMAGAHRHEISFGELVTLKQYFRVSMATLAVRLRQLEIITAAFYGRLWGQFRKSGFLTPPFDKEPSPLRGEAPRRIERLAMRAVSESALSLSKAAEILRISVRELDHRLEASGI